MKRASVESGHVDLYNDWNCRCQRTGRLSVGSEKKVPRKILKEGLWKACMEFVCVCERERGCRIREGCFCIYIVSFLLLPPQFFMH